MVQPSIFHHSNLADPEVIGRVGRKLGKLMDLGASQGGGGNRGEIRIMSHLNPRYNCNKTPHLHLGSLVI